ncbi:MAG: FtsX-like permease family protein [Thermoproteota archaeon]|nr:FtsX-like permease family protein [Thermoproteota archaeon]
MNVNEIFLLSFDALKERKVRSVLTILMVVVGSSLMVALNGLGAGFGKFIDESFSMLAPNILFVSSAQQDQSAAGPFGGGGPPPVPKITLNSAVESRLRSLPFVSDVISSYQAQVQLETSGKILSTSVFSIDPAKLYTIAPTIEFEEGSALRSNDPTAIYLADQIAYPPGENAPFATIGQTMRAKYTFVDEVGNQQEESRSFVVRGIMKPTGNPTIDNAVVFNEDAGNALMHKSGKYDGLLVVAESGEFVNTVEEEIRKLYGNDIGVTSPEAILKTIREFTGGFTVFILGIALVALLVGGVGIITTLYTSVMERTKEIGTMKAIGAQNTNILSLFIAEALMIGILGATCGLLAGMAGGYVLMAGISSGGGTEEGGAATAPTNISPVFLPSDLATVWGISVGLSLIAGIYPAWKASRLSPIVALRRE